MASVKKCRICKQHKRNEEVKRVGISYQCVKPCSNFEKPELKQLDTPKIKPCIKIKKKPAKKKDRVNPKIRASAEGEKCTLRVSPECQDGETVVACHLNTPFKGVGLKSHDLFVVNACYACHLLLDSSQVSHKDQLRALFETQKLNLDKGLIIMKGAEK